ncbi:MAG: MoaD/ThiS family protein [Chloroflexi bacterium]|nr:MoaD/ThiS family protein [Chloroflexota bacterium]
MDVTVRVYGHLVDLMGTRQLTLSLPDGSALDALLSHVPTPEPLGHSDIVALHILVDGRDHRLTGGMQTPLHSGAVVDLIPPFQGG